MDGKRKKGVEVIRSVNMHQLVVHFVERVLDVRRRHTDDGKASAPGESGIPGANPESTLCEGDPGARRRRMVVSSTVSHKVQGVPKM